jgi:hypothetical protein
MGWQLSKRSCRCHHSGYHTCIQGYNAVHLRACPAAPFFFCCCQPATGVCSMHSRAHVNTRMLDDVFITGACRAPTATLRWLQLVPTQRLLSAQKTPVTLHVLGPRRIIHAGCQHGLHAASVANNCMDAYLHPACCCARAASAAVLMTAFLCPMPSTATTCTMSVAIRKVPAGGHDTACWSDVA